MKITLNNQSLNDIRKEFPDCFYNQSWYDKQDFANEKITGTWDVSLKPVKDSFNKTWSEQKELLEKGNEVPPVAVLVYAMCKSFKETGNRAFEEVYVRTSSIDSDGRHVDVGSFVAEGLGVNIYWDGSCHVALGLASARKLEPCTLESLEHSDSLNLESAIKIVKEAGYQVAKIV